MKIGIITAMSSEQKQVAQLLENKKEYTEGPFQYTEGSIRNNTIILMKCGIGKVNAAAGTVHTLPKGYRRIFTMKRYEVEFPLKHPRYVIENVAYKKAVYRIMGWGHPWIKIGRSFEELFLNLRYGNFSIITKAIKNRINKWLKRDQHR